MIELLITSVTAEIVLGHFFKRALEVGFNLQFVEFKEWVIFCTSSLITGEKHSKVDPIKHSVSVLKMIAAKGVLTID